jgi:hypothetical protein
MTLVIDILFASSLVNDRLIAFHGKYSDKLGNLSLCTPQSSEEVDRSNPSVPQHRQAALTFVETCGGRYERS